MNQKSERFVDMTPEQQQFLLNCARKSKQVFYNFVLEAKKGDEDCMAILLELGYTVDQILDESNSETSAADNT